ncbi:MAG: type II toxin-antitoxin system VapB family antitoxin [Balneolaceae bacterium]|nr:type II toxin-antitoxin system VapB family antitoxin [Balneolaceae bacterium]
MPTNLAIDDKLINEAKRLGNHKTKKSAVIEALVEYIQRRKQQEIIKLFNSIDYEIDYHYKVQRKKS